MTTGQKAEKLIEFSNYEGTELGEVWNSIGQIWFLSRSCFTDPFLKALELEICEQYDYIIENFKMVEEDQTVTQKVKTLEFIG